MTTGGEPVRYATTLPRDTMSKDAIVSDDLAKKFAKKIPYLKRVRDEGLDIIDAS